MLSIQEALAKEVDENVNVKAVNVELQSVDEKPRFKAVFFIADTTTSTKCVSYAQQHQVIVKKPTPQGLLILNAINKQSHLVLTSRSILSMTPTFEIPARVMDNMGVGKVSPVKDALGSQVSALVTIRAKVTDVKIPPEMRDTYGTPRKFSEVRIADESGGGTLALWGSCTDAASAGTVMEISKVRVKLFHDKKRLSTTSASQMQLIPSSTDHQEWVDLSDDEDEYGAASATDVKEGTILAITSADPYLSCPVAKCNNVKLQAEAGSATSDGDSERILLKCPTHHGHVAASAANHSLVAKVVFETKTGLENATMFKPMLEQLFAKKGLEFTHSLDRSTVLDELMRLIPMVIKYRLNASGVLHSIL